MVSRGAEAANIVQLMCQQLHEDISACYTDLSMVMQIGCQEALTGTEGVLALCGAVPGKVDAISALNTVQKSKDISTTTLRQLLCQNVYWRERAAGEVPSACVSTTHA